MTAKPADGLGPAAEARIRKTKAFALSALLVFSAACAVAYLLPPRLAAPIKPILFILATFGCYRLWPRVEVWLWRRARSSQPKSEGAEPIDPS